MKRITTESRAVYLLDLEQRRIKRQNPNHTKRGDGEWQPLLNIQPFPPKVGDRLVIAMESLAHYGADDYGNRDGVDMTARLTTPVVSIEEVCE